MNKILNMMKIDKEKKKKEETKKMDLIRRNKKVNIKLQKIFQKIFYG